MWFLPLGRVQGWRANSGPSAHHEWVCGCTQRMCWHQKDRMWWDLECWGSQQADRQTLLKLSRASPVCPMDLATGMCWEVLGCAHAALSLPIACLPSPQIQPWPILEGRVLVSLWPQWLLIYQDLTPSKAVFAKCLQTWSGKYKRSLQSVISCPKQKGWKDFSSLGLPIYRHATSLRNDPVLMIYHNHRIIEYPSLEGTH